MSTGTSTPANKSSDYLYYSPGPEPMDPNVDPLWGPKKENPTFNTNWNLVGKKKKISLDHTAIKNKKPKISVSPNSHDMTKEILSDPRLLEPHKFGWRREFVIRNMQESQLKISGDVYYHPPKGKKLRSMNEIEKYCK